MDFYLSLELLSFILCLFICKGVQADYNGGYGDYDGLSTGAIVGIVIGVLVFKILLLVLICRRWCINRQLSNAGAVIIHGPPPPSAQVTNVYVPDQPGMCNPGYNPSQYYPAGQHPTPAQLFYNPQSQPEPPPKY